MWGMAAVLFNSSVAQSYAVLPGGGISANAQPMPAAQAAMQVPLELLGTAPSEAGL